MGTPLEATQFVGMDFDNPALDMQRIAEGFAARSETIENVRDITEVLGRALDHQGPTFLIVKREP